VSSWDPHAARGRSPPATGKSSVVGRKIQAASPACLASPVLLPSPTLKRACKHCVHALAPIFSVAHAHPRH
jgi:hypothetical protein